MIEVCKLRVGGSTLVAIEHGAETRICALQTTAAVHLANLDILWDALRTDPATGKELW